EESLAALKRDPVVQKLEPQKARTVVVHTKATKGKPATTHTKTIPPGKTTPGFPAGYQVMAAPNRTVVITCDATVATACPGLAAPPVPGIEYFYLFKHGVYPGDTNSPYPQMTGK